LQGVTLTHACIASTASLVALTPSHFTPSTSTLPSGLEEDVLPVTSYMSLEDSLEEEREYIGAAFLKHVFGKEQEFQCSSRGV